MGANSEMVAGSGSVGQIAWEEIAKKKAEAFTGRRIRNVDELQPARLPESTDGC